MAGFGDIPLKAGFTSMGELADLMMEKRKMEQSKYLEEMRNAQRAKEAADQAKYQQGMLGIHQGAEARARELHKYALQKAIIENQFKQRFAQDYDGQDSGGYPPPANPNDTSMLNQMIQNGNPDQEPRIPGSAPRIGTPPDIVRQNPDLDYQRRAANITQNEGTQSPPPFLTSMVDSPFGQPQQPNMEFMPQQTQEPPSSEMLNQAQGNPPPQGSPFQVLQQRLNNGETVQIKGPSPNKNSRMNKYAGQTIMGIKVPALKEHDVDGIRYVTYPDESVQAYKVGPSYEEKEEMKLDSARAKEQAKANVKISEKTEENGKIALKSSHYIKNMVDEFIKDPNLTSAAYAIPIVGSFAAKASGEGLGRFDAATSQYQSEAAKLQSSRGGIGILNFMQSTKPDRANAPARNRGFIIANAQKIQDIYDQEKSQWERANPGKEYPIEDPNVVEYANKLLNKDTVTIIDPSGKEHQILRNHLQAALAKHPGTRVKGEENAE